MDYLFRSLAGHCNFCDWESRCVGSNDTMLGQMLEINYTNEMLKRIVLLLA